MKRPPREWFERCVTDVASSGRAVDPKAVCGATWARKTPTEKRKTIRTEEGSRMATKKKKGKKHGGHKKKGSHKKKPAHAAHHPKRSKAKKKEKHHSCAGCGHSAKHDAKAGCLHFSGGKFCSCRQRLSRH